MCASAVTPWQKAWREGVAPLLSTAGLEALQKALESDDPALIQGQSVLPVPFRTHESEPVVAACAIGFAAWKECQGCPPAGEVESRFAELCCKADELLKDPGAVHFFLTQYDSWSREEMRRNLLPEVSLALAERQRVSGSPEGGTEAQQAEPIPIKPPKKMAPSIGDQIPIPERKTS